MIKNTFFQGIFLLVISFLALPSFVNRVQQIPINVFANQVVGGSDNACDGDPQFVSIGVGATAVNSKPACLSTLQPGTPKFPPSGTGSSCTTNFLYNQCVSCNTSQSVSQDSCTGRYLIGPNKSDTGCASWCSANPPPPPPPGDTNSSSSCFGYPSPQALANYVWSASCNTSCTIHSEFAPDLTKENSDCPENTSDSYVNPATSNWCYAPMPNHSGWCLQLQYNGPRN